ncbi:hypothetical protein J416_03356 [Gracilibacillus halophilus YIM-C55.5]|uniref:Gfo/Idh/MocA-like oxidoreductase N-terminal domain-containing protein n=1 Tax=Gracilibacillus halophilus YIM-C55.5 TaxID=1308866 RepID=N4WU28_9BACI|nr:Gfo/Idh/MocA family oxidoreductase [Gracilibacillus halophilus]ENH97865.1 hypothetical protein J416_03356 [Gracilibacillus halophilus YIM-C55.5]
MNQQVSVVLVGIAGYGQMYVKEILDKQNVNAFVKGVVDVTPEKSTYYSLIQQRQIPIYASLEEFYQHHEADLAILSTPIHLHKRQACLAMENGSHVLCEKPATANTEDVKKMQETRDRTGKFLAIGFNWSFTDAVQSLKQDILRGAFGQAKRMKSVVLWPRNQAYFQRSSWAGKQYSPTGEAIFDSVANNATAHFLHHLLYVNGGRMDTSATIKTVTAELYRANPIETFDTCAVRLQTENDIEILYYASHAVPENHAPQYQLEFEEAMIDYNPNEHGRNITVRWNDGSITEYPDPEQDHTAKLHVCIQAIRENHQDILCGIEAGAQHVKAIDAMHKSVPSIPTFPENWMAYDEQNQLITVDDLADTLKECYLKACLPHELNVEWSQPGNRIQL